MQTLKAIVYVSNAIVPYSDRELEDLLADARAFNARADVTGVLLYNDGTFFQYIEGPPDGVDEAFERIRGSHRHRNIIEILNEPVAERAFADWRMGFAQAPRSLLLQLEQAQWTRWAAGKRIGEEPLGVELLLGFWANARRLPGPLSGR